MAKLLLYDPGLKAFVPNLGKLWTIDTKEQKPIRDLKGLAHEIGQHATLDELVLFFHGFPGGIKLGNKGFGLSDADLRKAFSKKTKINVIRFEGCWVGERPDEMAKFGTIFDASRVSGFTWEGVKANATVPVLKGEKADAIGLRLKPFERWIADKMPSASDLASLAQNSPISRVLLLEWWQMFVIQQAPPYEKPKGQTRTNFERFGSHTYKRRSDATAKTIKAKDTEDSSEPISTFEYVTVTK